MNNKQLRYAFLVFFGAFCIWIVWNSINQMAEINSFIDAEAAGTQEDLGEQSLEIGTLKIANVQARELEQPASKSEWKMYISVLNLDEQTPRFLRDKILLDPSKQEQKIYGLEGHPSFLINREDLSFWKSQFYMQIIFYFGGYLIIGLLFILFNEMKFRKQKLFITPVKNIIMSFALLFLVGIFIKMGLDWRLFSFLNEHYYLGENIPPISKTLLYLGTPTFILGVYLEQAVRLQKEQDLTI